MLGHHIGLEFLSARTVYNSSGSFLKRWISYALYDRSMFYRILTNKINVVVNEFVVVDRFG